MAEVMSSVRAWLQGRRIPVWAGPAVVWLVAALILAVVAQQFVANGREGLVGSSEEVPAGAVPTALSLRPESMTTPVVVASRYATSNRYLAEIHPVSVVEGKLGDLNLSDPSEVAGMRVFYVTYTVRYLSGYAVPGYPDVSVRLLPGPKGPPALPNGMKNWNPTPCQIPKLRAGFAFGKGTSLTVCRVNLARPGDPVGTLQLEPYDYKGVALNRPNDVRWPIARP